MKLIVPTLALKNAFDAFYDDYIRHDAMNAERYRLGHHDYASYIHQLDNEANGINLRTGYVPSDHYWLVDNHCSHLLGCIRLRHRIDNDFLYQEGGHIGYDMMPSARRQGNGSLMLKLVLVKAREKGFSKVLVTADQDNIASRKVIENNGGQLENMIFGPVLSRCIARYWIDLTNYPCSC
ncbi:GNAT family N-acetyltransferase [Celerinatantimonas yamalensis]|uniref:GNAT family N-acetyltransferase n=1 Tax=Celerinatantimonas yamalensis TaxID=559956 RepID=A0ABW9G4P2_9GAMM